MALVPARGPTGRQGLAATPFGRALQRLGRKQSPAGGMDTGFRALRGRRAMPRAIAHYMDTYGGTDDSVIWVYACATLIADTISGYPWDVLDPEDDVLQPDEVPEELADLLDRPNLLITYQDWITWLVLDLELGGNSYWLKDRQNALGQPFELLRLRPELVQRAVDDAGRPIGHVYRINGREIPFRLDDVIWYRYPDPRDELYGIGTVEAILRELGADLAAREHVVGFYSNGGRISGVVTIDGAMGQVQFERLERQLEEETMVVGTDFRVLIVEQGNRFDPVTQAPTGTDVVPLQKMSKDRILSGFNVPEPLLGGVLENANYKITDSRYVLAGRLKPKADRLSSRTTIDLVDRWDGLQFRMDVTVDEPPHERAERVKNMRGSGTSLNELRDGLGLMPIDDPLADEPLVAQDLLPASIVLGLAAHPATQPQTVIQPGTPPGEIAPPAAPAEGEPLPDEPDADADPSDMPGGGSARRMHRMQAKRPRTRQRNRVRRAKSRVDALGDRWLPPHLLRRVQRELEQRMMDELAQYTAGGNGSVAVGGRAQAVLPPASALALPPSPQERGQPIVVPPLPDGYEQFGEVVIKRASPAVAVRLLAHRHELLRNEYPVWVQALADFFYDQRQRVLERLHEFGGNERSVRLGRKKAKRDLTTDALWPRDLERDALTAAYLPLVDRIGNEAMLQVGEMIGSSIRWDLAHPAIQEVRARLASKVTRVNDTTRQAIANEVDVGLQRGYSITQIANGVPAETYNGIVGVFDQASRYRAEMIARSETAMVYNDTANAGYIDAGVAEVEVIDGTGDDVCAEANGSVWTLDEAADEPIGHPNCVRAFVPVIPTGGLAAVPQRKRLRRPAAKGSYVGYITAADMEPYGIMCSGEDCGRVFNEGDQYVGAQVGDDIYVVLCMACGAAYLPASGAPAVVEGEATELEGKPWHIVENSSQCPADKPYAVVKDDTGEVVGCHATRADAEAHLAALYAND